MVSALVQYVLQVKRLSFKKLEFGRSTSLQKLQPPACENWKEHTEAEENVALLDEAEEIGARPVKAEEIAARPT